MTTPNNFNFPPPDPSTRSSYAPPPAELYGITPTKVTDVISAVSDLRDKVTDPLRAEIDDIEGLSKRRRIAKKLGSAAALVVGYKVMGEFVDPLEASDAYTRLIMPLSLTVAGISRSIAKPKSDRSVEWEDKPGVIQSSIQLSRESRLWLNEKGLKRKQKAVDKRVKLIDDEKKYNEIRTVRSNSDFEHHNLLRSSINVSARKKTKAALRSSKSAERVAKNNSYTRYLGEDLNELKYKAKKKERKVKKLRDLVG